MKRNVLYILPLVLPCLVMVYVLFTSRSLPCDNTDKLLPRTPEEVASSALPLITSPTANSVATLPLGKYLKGTTAAASVKNKFSIIIPTYKRVKLLTRVLTNYCSLSSHIDVIIVVWNNLKEPIPDSLRNMECDVTLHWKVEKVNSLNNRFLPYAEIKTEAVLSADDDLLISHEDLIFQFQTWQRFKHLLVGFAARRHLEQPPGSGKYVYVKKVSRADPRYSFILTTSAMFHVMYLEVYQRRLPSELRKFIDDNMNCEDLLINAIIAEHLQNVTGEKQCPALMLEQTDIQLIERENDGYQGLWHRQKHKGVREECLSLIVKHFNNDIPFDYSAVKVTRVFPIGLEEVKIS